MSQKHIPLSLIVSSNISKISKIYITNIINITIITNITNITNIFIYVYLKNNSFLIKLKEKKRK